MTNNFLIFTYKDDMKPVKNLYECVWISNYGWQNALKIEISLTGTQDQEEQL